MQRGVRGLQCVYRKQKRIILALRLSKRGALAGKLRGKRWGVADGAQPSAGIVADALRFAAPHLQSAQTGLQLCARTDGTLGRLVRHSRLRLPGEHFAAQPRLPRPLRKSVCLGILRESGVDTGGNAGNVGDGDQREQLPQDTEIQILLRGGIGGGFLKGVFQRLKAL